MKVDLGQAQFGPKALKIEVSTHTNDDLKDKLESDFQKDGKPASWAEGYPKQWGGEHWRFSTGDDPRLAVSSTSAASDEKFLAISTQNSICIFAVDGFKLTSVLKSNYNFVHKMEFASLSKGGKDGYVLAVHSQRDFSGRDSQVKVWFLDDEGKERKDKKGKSDDWAVKGKFPTFAPRAFSHDCRMLLYLSEVHDEWGVHPRVTAADAETGKEKFHMQGHTGAIMWAGFSPDDKLIATTSWDGYCKLYDGKSGKHIRDYGPTGGQNWVCEFSIDSKNLAVSRGSGGVSTFVWRTDDPQSFPITLEGRQGWQRVISWSPDGNRLAIGAADGRLVVYDARSMTLEQVWQLAMTPNRWIHEVTEIKWLEDGKKLLFKPSDGSTHMYDFKKNLKWKWGPGEKDKWRSGAWFSTSIVMEKRGLLGSVDQDGSFRIWKIPEQ